ncbi:tyrosine-type recombinase/integrase [Henriciella barbarensis]|uniref:tyrosine-type recombinase/integrase n=1 Tax=Henriciella barbarensis TaxID=86342 RepID=UPI0015FD1B48|nr:site-specific integrase [Henriciella barbarensis]
MKHLKLLPNGKYQYRRIWPQDVRDALPDLPRELKKSFLAPGGQDEAILTAVTLNREFDRTLRSIRENGGEAPAWETAAKVRKWHAENSVELASVLLERLGFDNHGNPVTIEETAGSMEIDRILEAAEKRYGSSLEGGPAKLSLEDRMKIEAINKGSVSATAITVQEAFELYTQKKKAGRVDRQAQNALRQFMEFHGNMSVSDIRSPLVMDWLDHLVDNRKQGYETVKKRLGAMKAMVNFAKKRGAFVGDNPFVGHQPPDHAKATLDRLPFHEVHLAALDKYLARGSVLEETAWVVQLLKYTGCRPSEIGGLMAEDLSLDGDLPFALVRWSEDRRLKTNDSERRVPLLAGALEAARAAKARTPEGWLFPSLAPSSGDLNDNNRISARINAVIRNAGIFDTPQLVCYSFRHTMAAALDQTPDIAHVVRERVLGRRRAQYGAKEQPLVESHNALSGALAYLGKSDAVLYKPEMLKVSRSDKG